MNLEADIYMTCNNESGRNTNIDLLTNLAPCEQL